MPLPPATLLQFPDASFDVVIDKGGLDALTGEPGDEGAVAGAAFLREVKRVLRPGSGRYLCVSLAQEHVIGEPAIIVDDNTLVVGRVRGVCDKEEGADSS